MGFTKTTMKALGLTAALTTASAAAAEDTAYITNVDLDGSKFFYTIEGVGKDARTVNGQVWYIAPYGISNEEMKAQLEERVSEFNEYMNAVGGKVPVEYTIAEDVQPEWEGGEYYAQDVTFANKELTGASDRAQNILDSIIGAASGSADLIDWPKTNAARGDCDVSDMRKVQVSYDEAGSVTFTSDGVSNVFKAHASDDGRLAAGEYYMTQQNFEGGSLDNGINYASGFKPDENEPYCAAPDSGSITLEP